MSIESIAEVSLNRSVDISPGIGEVTSLNDIVKESMAKTTGGVNADKQNITRMMNSDNLADSSAIGAIQKAMLVYSNTVAFIGTAARKLVATAETLLRSS
ncbi:type III secretion system inner rod subunit SctI [Acerihabitans sp. KWT182]|uniref:Type III secretion system inner rod subunit SctI n=1 Tax=Acerihabitans sp. KWT182 TaxID=3157919 RepID=A0AAU7QB43_9GAMM